MYFTIFLVFLITSFIFRRFRFQSLIVPSCVIHFCAALWMQKTFLFMDVLWVEQEKIITETKMNDEEGILTILLVQGCCRCWTGCCGPSHLSSEYNEIQQSFHCQTHLRHHHRKHQLLCHCQGLYDILYSTNPSYYRRPKSLTS